jgi:Protein of unknown function (DUF3761)
MFENYIAEEKPPINYRPILKNIAIGIAAVCVFSWLFLRPPYNVTYLFKRAFYTPTAVCVDGIYSFSASRSGSCSGHKGVRRWIK